MGITVGPTYITEEGFEISPLYISLTNSRVIPLANGNVQLTFIFDAYKSREDKLANRSPIKLPYSWNIGDIIISKEQFDQSSFYQLAYRSLQGKYGGYTLSNIFEQGQVGSLEYRFNSSGYDINGYNAIGYNAQGYDRQGYNLEGFNVAGYNSQGYDLEGYNTGGYNSIGLDREGFNLQGYNSAGYDKSGYDIYGFNAQGFSMNGGYNYSGYLPDGTLAVLPSTVIAHNALFPKNPLSFAIRMDPANLQSYINTLQTEITNATPPEVTSEVVPEVDPETAPETPSETAPETPPEPPPETTPEPTSETPPETAPETAPEPTPETPPEPTPETPPETPPEPISEPTPEPTSEPPPQ